MRSFESRVVVITGAGSGIGRALALDLAARGARLAISDVDEAGLHETAALVQSATAQTVDLAVLDVSDRAGMDAYATAVASRFGRVNVVVNNAGVALSGDFLEVSYADIDWVMGINFSGVVNGTKAFLPHLIASGEGHLVNVSSLFGLITTPGSAAYCASKFAVRGLSESLRQEMLVGRHNVGVTVVHPGGVRTPIVRKARRSAGTADDEGAAAATFDAFARTMPERAAQLIVRGITARKPRVLIGADARLFHTLGTLTGARYQDILARFFAK